MITNKDIRVENGFLIINGDKFPLDGQSPEAIMQIVEDNSDSTPTENSDVPVKSGGIFTALAGVKDYVDAKFEISANTWFPDVYDLDTKIKTLTIDDCNTVVFKCGNLTIAYLITTVGSNLGTFQTMAQFRNFPGGCNTCLGGMVYSASWNNDPSNLKPHEIQASQSAVYFRPNVTADRGDFGTGTVSMLLFFATL